MRRQMAAWALASVLAMTPAIAVDSIDHGATPTTNLVVAGRCPGAQPSGVTALPDGRLLLSSPRSAADHGGPRLAAWHDGSITPFPNAPDQKHFISPLAITIDGNGRVWMIDEGSVAGDKGAPTPILFGIDAASGHIVQTIRLHAPAILPDTHVNDVRIDLTHGAQGTAYVSDMSLADHPALLFIDLATGAARRVLAGDASVSADPGFAMEVDGQMHRYDLKNPQMAQGNVDGVTLSADSSRLYWAPLSGRGLYSAPTALLADPGVPAADLKAAVRDEGEVGVADGMATAPDGALYFTDLERHAVVRRAPDGTLTMIAHDPRLISPDSLALVPGALWLTVGQWSRLPGFHDGRDLQEKPYLLVRITLPQP